MGASNTYIYDEKDNLSALLPALLQNKGIDPTAAMAMMNNNKGGFLGNGIGDIIALVIVAALFGNGNGNGIFGGGNNGSNAEREMLMQALQRNGVDISQLAQSIQCSNTQILQGINAVATQISTLAGQQGLSAQQIINALQAGNCTLSHQLAECCCSTKQVISEGFASLGYATRDQTCAIEKAIAASTEQILAGQRAAEMRDLQNKLDAEREKNAQQANAINNYQQTQTFANMLQQATQPLLVGLQKVQGDVDGIICKLPKTVTLPYSDAQAIPNCLYYNLFGAPFGNPNGSFF